MPPRSDKAFWRFARTEIKPTSRLDGSEPSPKRPRTDGISSMRQSCVLDGKDASEASTSHAKRIKLQVNLRKSIQIDDTDTSDDEPLMNLIAARSGRSKEGERTIVASGDQHNTGVGNASHLAQGSHGSDDEPLIDRVKARSHKQPETDTKMYPGAAPRADGDVEKSPDVPAAPSCLSPSYNAIYHTSRDDKTLFTGADTPEDLSSTTLMLQNSVYGEKASLTPAFESVSSAPSNPYAGSFEGFRRVPSPDRLFTNMRLQDVNKLILAMGRADRKRGAAKRSAQKNKAEKGKGKVGGKGKDEKKVELLLNADAAEDMPMADGCPDEVGVEAPENVEMDDSDGFNGTGVHAGGDADEERVDSDDTMGGDKDDECAASPAAAKKLRMVEVPDFEPRASALNEAITKASKASAKRETCIRRAARSTPATEITNLTEDEPTELPPTIPHTITKSAVSLADQLFLEPPSPLPPSECPKGAVKREADFLKGFNTHWWAGGLSHRAAIQSVNAALRSSIPRFSEEEGRFCLRSLFAQNKLAIRHDLVYHQDCDPGANAPPPTPLKERQYISPSQQLARDLRRVEMQPYRSSFGKISEARYRVLEMRLESAVRMERTVFQDGDETMKGCARAVNEWMSEGMKFSEKEVRAALEYLVRQGKVEIEGDVVRLVSWE
ncbi:hypothetical protein BU25DRAFT_495981 [Macroventuria anomochaeta]|uniref:Uncharacterized protein n=1 Tax=Macroventuria anomochaeta TaxID=301207 RepID=A0ACB6RGN0_9PLEO|nr:uncharacterized protein BU25DRAFT_495981 [Macroventuria anomochaeta]KAF2621111.1 hypothetical protein BU25DRAFT_495981 [Macroventuria anomochaeta]